MDESAYYFILLCFKSDIDPRLNLYVSPSEFSVCELHFSLSFYTTVNTLEFKDMLHISVRKALESHNL